jgi:ribonuclease HI
MKIKLYIDGGARGNPGPAGCGVVLLHDGEVLLERGKWLGHATNNVAEYTGLLHGLELAAQLNATEIEVYSDSQLLVRQISGQYRVRAAHLKPLCEEARQRLRKFDSYTVDYIPRAQNKDADRLANMAMDAKADVAG